MIAAAANAVPLASVALGENVYFGSKNLLVSWCAGSNVLRVLHSVTGCINAMCVKDDGASLLVGTDKGALCEFALPSGEMRTLHQFEQAITCLCADSEKQRWAAGCLDGRIYVFSGTSTVPCKTVHFKGYALCATFCGPLLVASGTCSQIMCHHLEEDTSAMVSGHENWVRSLSVQKVSDSEYLLASASQERYIRIWKLYTSESEADDVFSTTQRVGAWRIAFEALLMGHDDWVLSVAWDPLNSKKLLSSSADSSLIVWEAEESSELWTPVHRLGDVSTWGASTATGTSGGFWTCIWLPNSVATVTRTGSWRLWERDEWVPRPGPTGHFRETTDVAWFNEQLLLSTSLDQTTRMWFVVGQEAENTALREVGRPQIHGYDMVAIGVLNERAFVSAGEEKILRVFELPRQVADQVDELMNSSQYAQAELSQVAGVPALGLSNKPESDGAVTKIPSVPREDHLQRLTLWPEIDKLYGHGYEISTLAVSESLRTVVSCCRANSEQHAKLRFYSSDSWREVGKPVGGHSLTVTRLKVSPNGRNVLSVGRDRKFMLVDISSHEVLLNVPKAHSRIIWDCCWCDDETFMTASRDRSIKKWNTKGDLLKEVKLDNPVTAIDYRDGVVAAGDETGKVTYLSDDLDPKSSADLFGRVNRISFNKSLVAIATDLLVAVLETPKFSKIEHQSGVQ